MQTLDPSLVTAMVSLGVGVLMVLGGGSKRLLELRPPVRRRPRRRRRFIRERGCGPRSGTASRR